MTAVPLVLPENEALALYQRLHRSAQDQEVYCETYRQLQSHFFQTMTVDQVTKLLEGEP